MKGLVKITLMYGNKPQGSYIDHVSNVDLGALFDDDSCYKIETVEITNEEFEKLPEFQGF